MAPTPRGVIQRAGRRASICARSQMIVVIVRNKHGVYGWQIVKCERWREEALWTGPLYWTRALVPNRINEYAHPIHFNQGGGVTEPSNAEAGLWACCINSWIGVKRAQRVPGRIPVPS